MRAIQPLDLTKPDPRTPQLFGTLPTIDGYDVILLDTGRPVNHRATLRSASGVASVMNRAARNGPKALTRALGSPD